MGQHGLFHASGLRCPRSVVVHCAADVAEAMPSFSDGTIVFKPNAGGFGKGIVMFSDREALRKHSESPSAYGNDGVALLQEFSAVTQTHRVFILGDSVQCSVSVSIDKGQVTGQCMASAAKRLKVDGGAAVAVEEISDNIRKGCITAMRKAGADVGSIEYLICTGSDVPLYYDLNLLSTYPDVKIVGKDCWLELAEFIAAKVGK